MSSESGLRTTSRRGLLAAVAGGIGAAVAGTLGRVAPSEAASGYVKLGDQNPTIYQTYISNTGNSGSALVLDAAGAGYALYATSSSGSGVYASSAAAADGIVGVSDTGAGVSGASNSGYAMKGYNLSTTSAAIIGQSGYGSTGVQGVSGGGDPPASPANTGVYGAAAIDAGSVGVRGASGTGRGGVFKGKLAQVKLQPATTAHHPASGAMGDLFVDKSGRLWFCKGGTIWKQIA